MKEEFLHFIWRFQLFSHQNLRLTSGEQLEIIHPGYTNDHAGPDFSQGSIRIDGVEFYGAIEIHLQSSHWKVHRHHLDDLYLSVVLHVVWENNVPIYLGQEGDLPCLELKHLVDIKYLQEYQRLTKQSFEVPCERQIHQVNTVLISQWLQRQMVARIERKSLSLSFILERTKYDWERVAWILVARTLGGKVNADVFEMLMFKLPLSRIRLKCRSSEEVVSFLLGISGLLEQDGTDVIINNYRSIQPLIPTEPIPKLNWKYSRLHPSSFPHLRMAQLGRVIFAFEKLFQRFLSLSSRADIFDLFSKNKVGSMNDPKFTEWQLEQLIVNAIVPLITAYANYKGEAHYKEKAIDLLSECRAENNRITRKWKRLGIEAQDCAETQGMIELYNEFCAFKKCLNCRIGIDLLKSQPK